MNDIKNNNNRPSNPGGGGNGRFNRRKKKHFPRPRQPGAPKPSPASPADIPVAGMPGTGAGPLPPEKTAAGVTAAVTSAEAPAAAASASPEAPADPGDIPPVLSGEAGDSAYKIPDLSSFDSDADRPVKEVSENDPDAVEVIGVRFKPAGKVYYFSPGGVSVRRGDFAIVETARGAEYGEVFLPNRRVSGREIVLPLRPIVRIATKEDAEHNEENRKKEKAAFGVCIEKIAKHGLDMKLVDAQYAFDNSKLLFYFTSAGRVDFRELVKDLASVFRTRIELRQIGIRDEAKLLGGIGACGRALCCSTFLSDFMQVSIKMAKEQSLSLNSNKISGSCGRLMCCLRYEYDTYVDEIRQTPPVDSVVRTVDGDGVVTEINPLAGTVKVRLTDKSDIPPKHYNRADIKVLSRPQGGDRDRDRNGAETE